MKQTATCIIITKNEELNIERAVKSAKLLCNRIIVVDSGSADKTVQIAKDNGAEVFLHEFISHGKQFNWALDNCDISTDWVIRLDADEEITKEVANELSELFEKHKDDDVNGIVFRFKVYFLGKFLKHGAMYPFLKLCAFKAKKGRVIEELMRDQTVITDGKTIYLKNDCLHYDFKSLTDWINKHNTYASMELNNLYSKNGNDDQKLISSIKKTKKIRDGFFYKLPMFFRAKLYYLYIVIFKLAFLDGRPGLIHAYLHAFWYRYLIDSKIYEQNLKRKNK